MMKEHAMSAPSTANEHTHKTQKRPIAREKEEAEEGSMSPEATTSKKPKGSTKGLSSGGEEKKASITKPDRKSHSLESLLTGETVVVEQKAPPEGGRARRTVRACAGCGGKDTSAWWAMNETDDEESYLSYTAASAPTGLFSRVLSSQSTHFVLFC